MARKKDTPQKAALREMMGNYLKENNVKVKDGTDNSRNGHSQKTMHTSYGDMEIDIPRDRKGEFEPQIVKKLIITRQGIRV